MKLSKIVFVVMSSTVILTACGSNNQVDSNEKESSDQVQVIKKNASVELPTVVLSDSNYRKDFNEDVTYIKEITGVKVEDFNSENEIDLLDYYDSNMKDFKLDLISDYKLLTITMAQKVEGETIKEARGFYMLDKLTSFVEGEKEITDTVLDYQLSYVSTDYKVGDTGEDTGEVLIAVPKKYLSSNLQLKTIKRQDDDKEIIYIDLLTK